jgi:hypothetical protein
MNISLGKFDKIFFYSIPLSDREKIIYDPERVFYTILVDGIEAGVIGILLYSDKFLQILITKEFRGKGIFKKSIELLMKKHKIKRLNSTVKKDNIQSIKAHKKSGFIEMPKKIQNIYIQRNTLLKPYTRFIIFDKEYPKISFPEDEISNYIDTLDKKFAISTRISNEQDKYKADKIYMTNWLDLIKILSVRTYDDIKDHPYYDHLSKDQINQISSKKFDVIKFIKES